MENSFFISYTRRDLAWAEWIAWQLENKGYSTEIDVWDWHPGDNFISKMHQAVIDNKCILLVLSRAYFTSAYTQAEWTAALNQIFIDKNHHLITLRIDDVEPPGLLEPYVYIDLHELQENEALKRLLQHIKGERGKPSTSPHFPGKKQPRFPGTRQPVCHIPYLRNDNFTGREEILTQLDNLLKSSQPAALTQSRAITGLGGIGKTQIALEYVYRHLGSYEVIWWVHAENHQILTQDYLRFAHKMDLPEKEAREEQIIVEGVREWLGTHNDWLFVFDNVETPEGILDFLPRTQTGHLLITSRHQNWGKLCSPINITTWQRNESILFLKTRTNQAYETDMHTLADLLGDLPLGLEQAAGYINETGTSLASYCRLFQTRHRDLWNKESSPLHYKETVATTWSLALEEINRESPGGAVILNLCAYLAPENITHTLLRKTAPFIPENMAELLNDDLSLIKALKR